MSTDDDRDRPLAAFIREATGPGQWVGWWFEMPDSDGRDRLGAALFGDDGEALQDLDDPRGREVVVRAALTDPALARIVRDERARFLDDRGHPGTP